MKNNELYQEIRGFLISAVGATVLGVAMLLAILFGLPEPWILFLGAVLFFAAAGTNADEASKRVKRALLEIEEEKETLSEEFNKDSNILIRMIGMFIL